MTIEHVDSQPTPASHAYAVLGGASNDVPRRFIDFARVIGQEVGGAGVSLLYGGPPGGVLGAFIDGAIDAGATDITAIVPDLFRFEVRPPVVKNRYVPDFLARRDELSRLASAVLALPGGIGTYDEIFGLLEWRFHRVLPRSLRIYLVDFEAFWEPLRKLLEAGRETGFISQTHIEGIISIVGAADLGEVVRKGGATVG